MKTTLTNLPHNDFELRDRIAIQCEQRAVAYLAKKQVERLERIEQAQLFIAGLVIIAALITSLILG